MADNTTNGYLVNKVVSAVLLILEILVILFKLLVDICIQIYRLFIPKEEKSVVGEKVLITGTGHGIGKELAKQYGELGAEIICVDINPQSNQETVSELKKMGIKVHGFECDVSKRENVLELYKKVKAEVGDVTILVNNAGIMPTKRWNEQTSEDIRRIFEINVFAHFWLMQAFVPAMIKNDKGHVVGISSVAGLLGLPYITAYCGSKFAVRGIMEAMHEELRKDNKNIKFTTICPYMTDTGLCKKTYVRFPSVLDIRSAEQVASTIISVQRQDIKITTIPKFLFMFFNLLRILPESSQRTFIDFIDSGLLVN